LLKKQAEPSFEVPYVVGTSTQPKTYKRQYWDYHNIPSVFVPVSVRQTTDLTKYYIKSPAEMTRPELAELEKELRELEEQEEELQKLQAMGGTNLLETDQGEMEEEEHQADELKRGKKKRAIRKAAKADKTKELLIQDSDEEEESQSAKKFEIPKIEFTDLDRIKYEKVKNDPNFIEYLN
jgi:hypothetical protein